MKLGIVFNVWDGTELLESSINCISVFADYIVLISQAVSNHGIEDNAGLNECNRLKGFGYVDEVLIFRPDLSITAQQNEQKKRNLGLDDLRSEGCTHFLMLDVDEFYNEKQVAQALKEIEKNDYDLTFCSIFTYYKFPIVQLSPPESYYVPFICKLTDDLKLGCKKIQDIPEVDPTRRMPAGNNMRTFLIGELAMHHMTFVRQDLRKKIINSSALKNRKDIEAIVNAHGVFRIGSAGPVLFYERWHNITYVPDSFDLMPEVTGWI